MIENKNLVELVKYVEGLAPKEKEAWKKKNVINPYMVTKKYDLYISQMARYFSAFLGIRPLEKEIAEDGTMKTPWNPYSSQTQ